MPWPSADWTFSPPGYRPSPDRRFIVPIYPAGLPLVMAVFQRVSGRTAVFYVVPMLGAIAVLMTGWLGARIDRPLTGVIAAAVLASSPSFLYQVVQPVSDVAATAWWTTALAFAVGGAPLGAGLAASLAVLTRPNLVPLVAVFAIFFARSSVSTRDGARRSSVRNAAVFVAGLVPGCLGVAAIDYHLYGSPLRSGYGDFSTL